MTTEYSFFAMDYEESVSSDSSDSQHICWKTKYCQLLNEYEQLLCCYHCHVHNMNSTISEEENPKTSIIDVLKQKNQQLVKTLMDLQRDIKYKIPLGPPLIPPHDMSLNTRHVVNIYTHPAYADKHHFHRDVSMNIPHHIYPHPIPYHPGSKESPIMPQNAHIPPPIIQHPHPSTSQIKPLTKNILNYPYRYPYLYSGYPYFGYPYSRYPYSYGYGYPYYSSYYPYYKRFPHGHHYKHGNDDNKYHNRDINPDVPPLHKPTPPPPPLHPVLHPTI
jgi:hypothetical protein